MWNPIARAHHNRASVRYNRASVRYGSDLTVAEWQIVEPFLPRACSRGRRRR